MSLKTLIQKLRDIEDRMENLEHDTENLNESMRSVRMQMEELTDLELSKLQELIDEKDD